MGCGETHQHFAPILTDRPHTEDAGLLPPAPERFLHRINEEIRDRLLTQISCPPRFVFFTYSGFHVDATR